LEDRPSTKGNNGTGYYDANPHIPTATNGTEKPRQERWTMGLFVIGFAPAKFRVRGVANVKKE
jgi:hypothetical protein